MCSCNWRGDVGMGGREGKENGGGGERRGGEGEGKGGGWRGMVRAVEGAL